MPSSSSAPAERAGPLTPAAARGAVISRLRCPVCAGSLAEAPHELHCAKRHAFSIARQGYVSLLSGHRATSGDDADMAIARDTFLSSGAYAPVAAEVAAQSAAIVARHRGGVPEGPDAKPADRPEGGPAAGGTASAPMIVEAGCGTGYYLAAALDAVPGACGFGFDTGVRGLRRAARAHERAVAASWDVYRPFPLANGAASVVLDVFSPRNPEEFHRALAPGGGLVIARPTADHLAGLRASVVGMVTIDPDKEPRLHRALDTRFTEEGTRLVEFSLPLSPELARALIAMTPSARHLQAASLRDDQLPRAVGVSVRVSSWRRR